MNNKGLGVIELLIVLCIIGGMAYFWAQNYSKGPVVDEPTAQVLSQQGIDTTSYSGVVDSTKTMVKGLEQKQAEAIAQYYNTQK